jgi:copper chaperone
MTTSFEIDNLKCSGCSGTITKALNSFKGLSQPHVDIEHETVSFEHPEGFQVEKVKSKLEGLGYPEKGTLSGLKKLGVNAISYVSCAIGKMTTES